MELHAILDLLSDGEFHSGAELGEVLGVSRTAVWKHLQKLDALGLSLTSVKGKGYCLEGGLELLDTQRVSSAIGEETRQLINELDIFSVTDSTNVRALEKASEGNASGYVCLAEQQTAGKGRRGREWVSPFGKNIYLSTVWGFDGGVAALEGLSLAVGIAVVEALESSGISDVQLKWPNDVLWRGQKLAGVLLEMTGDVAGYCQVVVGIGLNVAMPAGAGEAIDQTWVDVESILADGSERRAGAVSRNELAGHLLDALMPVLNTFHLQGFAPYRQRWEGLDAFRDKDVELRTTGHVTAGIARGLTDTGALCVEVGGELQHFNGGEVSLRLTETKAGE